MAKKDLSSAVANATSRLFTNVAPAAPAAPATPAAEPAPAAPKAMPKKVFSFRADEQLVNAWRTYAACHNVKVDEIGTVAMQEYMANHPLSGLELELFNQRTKG